MARVCRMEACFYLTNNPYLVILYCVYIRPLSHVCVCVSMCLYVTPGTSNSVSFHCWQCGSKVIFVFVVCYRNISLAPLFIADDFVFRVRPLLFSALVYLPSSATSPTSSRRTVVGSKQNSSTVSAQLTAGTLDKAGDTGELGTRCRGEVARRPAPISLPLSSKQKHFRYASRPQCRRNKTMRCHTPCSLDACQKNNCQTRGGFAFE